MVDLAKLGNARLHPDKLDELATACKDVVGDLDAGFFLFRKIIADIGEKYEDKSRDFAGFKNFIFEMESVKAELDETFGLMASETSASTTSQTEIDKLKKRVAQI